MTFGEFDVDTRAGELRRNGVKVKLQDLPFRVLVALLSRPGDVFSRDELRAALWGAETFVDAEAGLNTAIAKIREALGDSADAPRFIETVPKRGYRFVGRVEPALLDPVETPAPEPLTPPRGRRGWRWAVAAGVVAIALAVVAYAYRSSQRPVLAVVLFHNETGDATIDRVAQGLTDATVVALTEAGRFRVIGNAAELRTPRIFADLRKVSDALGADYVLLAQIQGTSAPHTVRLHFIRASDQVHLWAKSVTGEEATLERRVVDTALEHVR